jgi:hypothetical protein
MTDHIKREISQVTGLLSGQTVKNEHITQLKKKKILLQNGYRLILQTNELRSKIILKLLDKCYKTYGTVLISHFKLKEYLLYLSG